MKGFQIKDLLSAITITNGWLDYKLSNPSTLEFKENKSRGKNGKDNGLKFILKVDDSQSKNDKKGMTLENFLLISIQ